MTNAEFEQQDQELLHMMTGEAKPSEGCIHVTIPTGGKTKVVERKEAPALKAAAKAAAYPTYPVSDDYMPKLMASAKWAVIFAMAIVLAVIALNTGDISSRLGQILVPLLSAAGTGMTVATWIKK